MLTRKVELKNLRATCCLYNIGRRSPHRNCIRHHDHHRCIFSTSYCELTNLNPRVRSLDGAFELVDVDCADDGEGDWCCCYFDCGDDGFGFGQDYAVGCWCCLNVGRADVEAPQIGAIGSRIYHDSANARLSSPWTCCSRVSSSCTQRNNTHGPPETVC